MSAVFSKYSCSWWGVRTGSGNRSSVVGASRYGAASVVDDESELLSVIDMVSTKR